MNRGYMKQGFIVSTVIAILVAMFIYSQFFDETKQAGYGHEPISDSLIVATYPKLYEAINYREAERLNGFLNHESASIRKQAWRALASTPVDSTDHYNNYLQMALQSELTVPWFALSKHELSSDQLRTLETHWLEQPSNRAGISRVLGRQGDETTLQFLLDYLEDAAGTDYEYDYALAVGRLMIDFRIDTEERLKIFNQAFSSENENIICAYLYGSYRGDVQDLTGEEREVIYRNWKDYGMDNSSKVDQYVVKLLGGDVFYEITLYQNSENVLDLNIQLAVELAQAVKEVEISERNRLAIRILLMHENPHVAQQTLAGLKGELKRASNLHKFITSEIVEDSDSHPYVWLQALETIADLRPEIVKENSERLQQISEEHPYFFPGVLRIWQISETPEAYLERMDSIVEEGDLLKSQYAINALGAYRRVLSDDEQNEQLVSKIREIVFKALQLQDRGVAFASGALLSDESLFDESDFDRINRALSSFSLPEDIEVYQTFGSLYKQQFEEQAKPVVDSLASLGYAPLNRSFKQAGWDVAVPGDSGTEFRTPNWERIWEMGRNPIWVLQTEKGFIKVEMNTLSAPATVSAIDSLTLAGAYDGVSFHRVIPNFVIQGGDIERQDGYGGPDFVLPTEASELEFERGAAGIASAGTDTEGSQYFLMHQWKPHLNGSYTLFGKVTYGMDDVDRIVAGDKVLQAYWE